MSEIKPTPAASAAAAMADACRCHETPEATEEFPGCQCHLDAANDRAEVGLPPLPAGRVRVESREREAGWRLPVVVPQERPADCHLSGTAAGVLLLALLLGGAAFLVFALLPGVALAFALVLLGLAPLIVWGLFVFATLDLEAAAAARLPPEAPREFSPERAPGRVPQPR
jgi:hypothetical protein